MILTRLMSVFAATLLATTVAAAPRVTALSDALLLGVLCALAVTALVGMARG